MIVEVHVTSQKGGEIVSTVLRTPRGFKLLREMYISVEAVFMIPSLTTINSDQLQDIAIMFSVDPNPMIIRPDLEISMKL
jgi:hypothetical protein